MRKGDSSLTKIRSREVAKGGDNIIFNNNLGTRSSDKGVRSRKFTPPPPCQYHSSSLQPGNVTNAVTVPISGCLQEAEECLQL